MFSLFRRDRKAEARRPSVPAGRRVYAIGDVHGRFDLLQGLFATIAADSAARGPASVTLVMLGDLVDRGPQSREVIEALLQPPAFADEVVVLRGNHEAVFLDVLDDPATIWNGWLKFGGRDTLDSYGVAAQRVFGDARALGRSLTDHVPASHVAFLRRTQLSYRAGDYLFVHAGIRPGVAIDRQAAKDLLWIRDSFLGSTKDHGVVVVHGHTVAPEVEDLPNRIGIDTGAYRTGLLSALALEGEDRWFLSEQGAPADND